MELYLESGLKHQELPVESIADVFEDVSLKSGERLRHQNPIFDYTESRKQLVDNIIQAQQKENAHGGKYQKVPLANQQQTLTLDVKMETGTGKTYVYTHTMYELHKRYGVNKFIVVVPTHPIKTGAEAFLGDSSVMHHFSDTGGYDGVKIDLCVINAMKGKKKGRQFFPSSVRDFYWGSKDDDKTIFVALVNMQLLTNGKVLRGTFDNGYDGIHRPMDALKATRPFVIIDEPHKFDRKNAAYKVIMEQIAPQCLIRFGATFPENTVGRSKEKHTYIDYENLIYDLNAFDAFCNNLIKGVAKEHVEAEGNGTRLLKFTGSGGKEEAHFQLISATGKKSATLREGESLGGAFDIRDMDNLTISNIGNGMVDLSNGRELMTGMEISIDAYSDSYQRLMIQTALKRHFETERVNFNFPRKIKTIALFFIGDIESFRGENAWLREMFNVELKKQLEEQIACSDGDYRDFLQASLDNLEECSAGYFAQDKQDSDEEIEKEMDDILKNKKEMLRFKDDKSRWIVRRFFFSKWTLREGWDNPNVFTICKLRSSGSEISKLQEVGRGLRLPVDETGHRNTTTGFMLNYIVDFTDADFAERLVKEINSQLKVAHVIDKITEDDIRRVAGIRNMDPEELAEDLVSKKYVSLLTFKVKEENRITFLDEYPEFAVPDDFAGKIQNRNKAEQEKIKIRKENFDLLRDLWQKINSKYVLFFDNEINGKLAQALPNQILSFTDYYTARTDRQQVSTDEGDIAAVHEAGLEFTVKATRMAYGEYLKRLSRATSVPVDMLHEAIKTWSGNHPQIAINECFTEHTLSENINYIRNWMVENLQGRFHYCRTHFSPLQTALTDAKGDVLTEIVQARVGMKIEENAIVSDKYLYDKLVFDSPLERVNIRNDIDSVIVYGKIPTKSLQIPTIANSSYSPDFMYVVRRKGGKTDLNLIVETKAVDMDSQLRGDEKAKIASADLFFKSLEEEGYNVKYKRQINSKGVGEIIKEIMEQK
ncbi:MAG: type III restriction-modification system endonuclease [Bacteroidaceae bacterium]|nr:type III restriction-modification system endonuclease [Bacteroidaceae bacterium]